jgi:integrase
VIDVALLGIIRRWHIRDQVPLREIARRLGISRNTVRHYLRAETIEPACAERRSHRAIDKYAFQLSALLLIRAILRKAALDWEWIDKAPKVRLYQETKRRVRWITPEQANRLLAELPEHQRDVVLFALATGLRQSNVVGLTWQQVDLTRQTAWIPGDEAKGKEDIHVSLSSLSVELLQRQVGKHQERVFTYAGKPVTWVNTRAWKLALKRAGIEDFRWHDLRHTWASWLVQNGTPLYDLQEMGGWKSSEMVRRYAHFPSANLAKHAAIVEDVLRGTNSSQGEK